MNYFLCEWLYVAFEDHGKSLNNLLGSKLSKLIFQGMENIKFLLCIISSKVFISFEENYNYYDFFIVS